MRFGFWKNAKRRERESGRRRRVLAGERTRELGLEVEEEPFFSAFERDREREGDFGISKIR